MSDAVTDREQFLERLRSIVGRPGAPRVAKDPITAPAIRIWCEAVDDWNPAYQDPDWARRSRWGGIIAPATSLNMWTLPGNRRTHAPGEPLDRLNEILFSAGFTSVAAVTNEQSYVRPLRPGDHLQQVQHIGMVSEEKQTALGRGHFLDLVSDYSTLDGEALGRVTLRMLRWNPATKPADGPGPAGTAGASATPAACTRPARRESTLSPAEVRAGEQLPTWSLPVTQASIAALATATYDFNDVHLDRDAAVRRGAPDVYMNILGSSGLANCYLTDWAGPEAELRSIRVQLRKQNHPGDRLVFSGEVLAVTGRAVAVRVRGANSLGDHLLAEAELELPEGAE
jgi:acyl dehydratase